MPDATATLGTPKAGGASADSKPASTAGSVSVPAPEPSEEKGEIRDHGSRILASLSPQAYKKWQLTGLLPPDVELKDDPKREIGEGEKILSELTKEEYRTWEQTGKLPDKKAAETSEKTETSTEKGGESSEASHPLAKIDALRVSGAKDGEVDALHAARSKDHNTRFQADRGKYGDTDQAETNALAAKLLPMLPKGLLAYFNAAQVHLQNPYSFFRSFTRDQDFRSQVLTAAATGDLSQVVKIVTKFDGAQPVPKEPKKFTSAPAPAASISGKATAPIDEIEAALQEKNFSRYEEVANAEDHRRRKAGRG